VVAIGIGNVERRRRVDVGQTPQGDQAIVVRLGIIPGPTAAKEAKPAAAAGRGVHQAGPIKLRGYGGSVLVVLAAPPAELQRKQPDGEREQDRKCADALHELHGKKTSMSLEGYQNSGSISSSGWWPMPLAV